MIIIPPNGIEKNRINKELYSELTNRPKNSFFIRRGSVFTLTQKAKPLTSKGFDGCGLHRQNIEPLNPGFTNIV